MPTITITIRIPAIWRELIQRDFPRDLVGMASGRRRRALDDAQSYYDDNRAISVGLPNTVGSFTLCLLSGQSNYWGEYLFTNPDDDLTSEPLEAFPDVIEETFAGQPYHVRIEWV